MTAAILYQEAESLRQEAVDLENQAYQLEKLEEREKETLQAELRFIAMDLLEAAEGRLGGFDLDTLHLAIAKGDLSKDQLSRIKLLAREFLLVTL
jgi:hypothetical protein